MATILSPPARVSLATPERGPFFTLASIRRALKLSPGCRLEVITVRRVRPRLPTFEVLVARAPRAAARLPVNHRASQILAEARPNAPLVRGPVWHGVRVVERGWATAYA